MKKIGIYGGTFNPIHNGHLNIAKEIGNVLKLDSILIIPANVPPHKEGISIVEANHRYEMCRLACEDSDLFQVCNIEIKREGKSYTIDTLNEISQKYNKSKLYFIMGSDSFLSILSWIGFEEISKQAVLCTSPRNTSEIPLLVKMKQLLDSKGATTKICDIPVIPISSTQIRIRIAKGFCIEEMVPIKIAEYIKKNRLFMGHGIEL